MLCWLDLESTGLDPKLERILEIGFIITDDLLAREIARASWVIPFDAPVTTATLPVSFPDMAPLPLMAISAGMS